MHVPLGLFIALMLFGEITGGHMNPGVTLMMISNKSIPGNEGYLYMVAQYFGGLTGKNNNKIIFSNNFWTFFK